MFLALFFFSFFFSSPNVAPRFIFPLPSQDRKFIVKADYSSIYPPPRSSALTVFRLAAGSYRLTRLQPNIHTRLTLFISCNSQVFVLMPLADSCGWETAAEVPSRFDAARGIMSHPHPSTKSMAPWQDVSDADSVPPSSSQF